MKVLDRLKNKGLNNNNAAAMNADLTDAPECLLNLQNNKMVVIARTNTENLSTVNEKPKHLANNAPHRTWVNNEAEVQSPMCTAPVSIRIFTDLA